MARWVLIADVGNGQEAIVFGSLGHAERWLDLHPEVEELVQGGMPLTTTAAMVAGARA